MSLRRGVAIVEIAVTIMAVSALAFGTIEFGEYFYVKNNLETAAREGARAGVPPTARNADVVRAVNNALAGAGFATQGVNISITNGFGQMADVSATPIGSAIQVSVSISWGTAGSGYRPFALIGSGKLVTGVCTMHKGG